MDAMENEALRQYVALLESQLLEAYRAIAELRAALSEHEHSHHHAGGDEEAGGHG